MKSEFLNFNEVLNPGKKTKRFIVTNKAGEQLGWIYWKGAWRKYVYLTIQAEYDTKCMKDIVSFIDQLMEERRRG